MLVNRRRENENNRQRLARIHSTQFEPMKPGDLILCKLTLEYGIVLRVFEDGGTLEMVSSEKRRWAVISECRLINAIS